MDTDSEDGVDRRQLLSAGGGVLAAAGLAGAADAAAPAQLDPSRPLTITEGTNIAVSPSPDGRQLAFDLYGVIWTVPVTGGAAKRLTDDFTDGALPHWSPDGRRLVFQSYRDGNYHLWTVGADGTGLTQLTRGPFDCREPRFSPDGGRIACSSDVTGAYAIHVLDLATGASRVWASVEGQACEPCWSPDGARIAFAVDRARVLVADAAGQIAAGPSVRASADRMNPVELHSPSFAPDGGDIVVHVQERGRMEYRGAAGPLFEGEDLYPFRLAWLPGGDLVYAAGGRIRRRAAAGATDVPFSVTVPVARPRYAKARRDFERPGPRPVVGIGSPVLSPDGTAVVFRALNGLWLLPIGGTARRLVADGFWTCDPAWSSDGRTLAFSSDRGGKLDIWLRDMASGAERQLTRHTDAALAAAWSRDGRRIAFLDQAGALHVAEVADGRVTKLFNAIWEPGRPSWSPDGQTIAMAAFRPQAARYREGLSEILTIDVSSGAGRYEPILPNRSIGTRGDDGPVWSPDGGRMAFVFASRLHVAPVDAAGRLAGPPKALNDEVTDAPTWSGDGTKLLYLSNGRLRLIDAAGGAPRTVPHGVAWAAVKAQGRTVVRAGRVWNGQSPDLRRDVDIVIDGARIAGVLPPGQASLEGAKVVDARDATVMPGLVEMHAHRQMAGYGYGDREGRLWLSLGVTSARSPGSPAYQMVEDREAIDSGARMGPRYFSTGEAIDGSRIFYNFMRPVTEPGQMALELSRAEALGYDLIKTYVRLPFEAQREVTRWAHAHGMPVTSHYHYPSLSFGVDGMEHIGATTRVGYSRTVSAQGMAYQDVTALFAASGARRTPTLFTSSALYGIDRSLVDDPRIAALYPPWERARLLQRAEQAAGSDNAAPLSVLQSHVAHIRAILAAGGRVVTGTDSPIDFNGVSLHMNLRAMVKYGMTPHEALTTATRYAGEFLDQPLGVIAPGMLADLSIVDGDPLARIEDAAAVRAVVKNGLVFDMAAILGPFAQPGRAASARPVRQAARASPFWWHDPAWVQASRAACCEDPFCAPAGRGGFWATEI
jgi:Tol biopolymer transport system component